jgi:LAO/AO transport system ATPase
LSTPDYQPPRILLAKIGLDGHDRGVKVLARSFRDAGMEVIYTGLWQTCEATMYAALQEDVDVVGVSLLSAAHLTVLRELVRLRSELGIEYIPLVLGGIIPEADYPALREMGVAAIFNPGSPVDRIVEEIRVLAGKKSRPATQSLTEGYRNHDDRALARLITAVCRNEPAKPWPTLTPASSAGARVIGVTGAPGVGKSSFIGRLGRQLRGHGKKVAVVAVDPTSPVTGGALLGDRLRMMTGTPDRNLFIRSLSSRGVPGGLGPHVLDVIQMLRGYAFDYVLVETVGSGQGDVAVREVVDQVMLVLMPESGDAIQFFKAGITEIARAFVINKSDLPGADATEAQLRSAAGDGRPIWKVSAVRDEGFGPVAEWVLGR